jgi:hypothetical protein
MIRDYARNSKRRTSLVQLEGCAAVDVFHSSLLYGAMTGIRTRMFEFRIRQINRYLIKAESIIRIT